MKNCFSEILIALNICDRWAYSVLSHINIRLGLSTPSVCLTVGNTAIFKSTRRTRERVWRVFSLLKGTRAWNKFYVFAETESLWSQTRVTQDSWKSYSFRPRYSTFKHFRLGWVSAKIVSTLAQPAIEYVLQMLGQRWNSFWVCSAYFEWWFWNGLWFSLRLSMHENCLLVGWACSKFGYLFAEHVWILVTCIVGFACAYWQKLKEENQHFFRILINVI